MRCSSREAKPSYDSKRRRRLHGHQLRRGVGRRRASRQNRRALPVESPLAKSNVNAGGVGMGPSNGPLIGEAGAKGRGFPCDTQAAQLNRPCPQVGGPPCPKPGGRSAPRLCCSTPSGESDHLTRTAIGEHSKTGKAGQHHRPGGCLGGGNRHGVEKHAAVVAPNRLVERNQGARRRRGE